jgi:AcrR family transcriptional regulator
VISVDPRGWQFKNDYVSEVLAHPRNLQRHGTPADRRKEWRDRNRLAVVDALLDLFAEGNLRPGAQEVAERSGVSRRSVFRYFDDLEDLDRMAIDRAEQRVLHLLTIRERGRGTLEERIERIAEQRMRVHKEIQPIARVARLRAPFHPVISERLEVSRSYYAHQVARQFEPELERMEEPARGEILAAAVALCGFETFDFLADQGLNPEQYGAVVRRALRAYFVTC